MPRTKVSKSSKRNRDAAAKEEKIRNFESALEEYLNGLELQAIALIEDVDFKLNNLIDGSSASVLDMPIDEFIKMNLNQIRDYALVLSTRSEMLSSDSRSGKKLSAQDDGYITEESGNSASNSGLATYLSMTQRGRTPGPLSSARARQNRRSRSACTDQLHRSGIAPKQSSNPPTRVSRNKLRTPMAPRPKAISADRSIILKKMDRDPQSPQAAFLRWPKPGEFIVSVHGTPLTAPIVPERTANVNIPIKDGVLSLRPKNLANIDPNFLENIDPETVKQLKTLHKSLGMIVKITDQLEKN